jgi:hypothetical protein
MALTVFSTVASAAMTCFQNRPDEYRSTIAMRAPAIIAG